MIVKVDTDDEYEFARDMQVTVVFFDQISSQLINVLQEPNYCDAGSGLTYIVLHQP